MLKEKLKAKKKETNKELFMMSLLLKREDISILKKLIVFLAISYAVSPIDFIPDIIPFFGYLDDLLLIPSMLKLAKANIPSDVLLETKKQALNYPEQNIKVKWYYGIFTAFIFVAVFLFLILYLPKIDIMRAY